MLLLRLRPPGIRGLLRQHDGAVERHAGCAQHDQRGPDEGRVALGFPRRTIFYGELIRPLSA
jgi:hypothetical protein